jgi:protein-disulfide isomerase
MTTPFTVPPARLVLPVTDDDHIIGPETAPVTLVEYGDYQCPYCGFAYPAVKELLRLRGDVVRFAFRHFPLMEVHPFAELAAETAEAAGVRGRFWQMHDWLFEHQELIDPVHLAQGIADVGLPADEVVDEVNKHVHLDRIQRDFASGVRSGVGGTPTFFVNNFRHEGGYSVPELVDAVDQAAEAVQRGEVRTG